MCSFLFLQDDLILVFKLELAELPELEVLDLFCVAEARKLDAIIGMARSRSRVTGDRSRLLRVVRILSHRHPERTGAFPLFRVPMPPVVDGLSIHSLQHYVQDVVVDKSNPFQEVEEDFWRI